MIKTLAQLQNERAEQAKVLQEIDNQIQERKAETLVRCESNNYGKGCGLAFPIKELTYIQTHYYEGPYGCIGGDSWVTDEGQWLCQCTHRNRLYNKPDIVVLKNLFKNIVGEFND